MEWIDFGSTDKEKAFQIRGSFIVIRGTHGKKNWTMNPGKPGMYVEGEHSEESARRRAEVIYMQLSRNRELH